MYVMEKWNELYVIGNNVCKLVNDKYEIVYENIEINSKTSFKKNNKFVVVHKDYNELIESPYYDNVIYIDDYTSIVINNNKKGIFFSGEEVIKPIYEDIIIHPFFKLKYLNCIKKDHTSDFIILKDSYNNKIKHFESALNIKFLEDFILIYKEDKLIVYDYLNDINKNDKVKVYNNEINAMNYINTRRLVKEK